jgi:hypothetical protein
MERVAKDYGGLIMDKEVCTADVLVLFEELNDYLRQQGIRRVVYGEKYRLDDGIRLLQRAGIETTFVNLDNNGQQ